MSEFILTQLKNNALWVTLNRPKKFNAISSEMYGQLTEVFKSAEQNEKVDFVVFTGGDCKMYSAGSDFSPAEMMEMSKSKSDTIAAYKPFVDVLATFPKPIIALVNGPAIGMAVTTLGLMDVVICSDNATFSCPFGDIGLVPEACSSRTFVQIMGHQKAAAMMLFGEKFSAQDAYVAGLVAKVLPHSTFKEETAKLVEKYSKLSPQTLLIGKRLMRPENEVDHLLHVNRKEEILIRKCFKTKDTQNRLTSIFSKGSKL